MAFPNIWKKIDPVLIVIAFLVAVVIGVFQYFSQKPKKEPLRPDFANKSLAFLSLEKHTKEFKKELLSICDGKIHVAIGYGLANAILIEGRDSCVLIDTLESKDTALDALAEFQKVSKDKPIEAIILTQCQADHSFGAQVFLDAYPGARIYAHETFIKCFKEMFQHCFQIKQQRNAFHFGTAIEDDEFENAGIGPRLRFGKNQPILDVIPTHTFKDELKVTIQGLDLILIHASGASEDQIMVWWPEKEALFPGDNIYKAFPEMSPLSGKPSRNVLDWVKSIDMMRELKPKLLVPQHTRPIEGADKIMKTLTSFRDVMQFVHDQTVRHMNKGLYPDEIVAAIQLPPHMAQNPYLQECYGTLEWGIKAVFHFYMGWFTGRASELHPLGRKEQSEALVDLAGGPKNLEEKMKEAYYTGRYQWGLQLAEAMTDTGNSVTIAQTVKINCLRQLALCKTSAVGRNWYVTEALKEDGFNFRLLEAKDHQAIQSFEPLLGEFKVKLNFEKASHVKCSAVFHCIDLDQQFLLEIRLGVLEVASMKTNDLRAQDLLEVSTSGNSWRGILSGSISIEDAMKEDGVICKPDIDQFILFMSYFDI